MLLVMTHLLLRTTARIEPGLRMRQQLCKSRQVLAMVIESISVLSSAEGGGHADVGRCWNYHLLRLFQDLSAASDDS
jgi:hypothetical protein